MRMNTLSYIVFLYASCTRLISAFGWWVYLCKLEYLYRHQGSCLGVGEF